MRETITVSLPEDIKKQVDQIVSQEGISRNDVIRQSLDDYLFIRQFRKLRAKMMARAQAQGIHTDSDIFNRVS